MRTHLKIDMATLTNKQIIRSEKKRNNSTTISNSIISDKNLKPLDKIVLISILSEPNDTVLYQRTISKQLGVTLGTVIKSFKNLETFGYMVREKDNGNVDNYIIYENGYVKTSQVADKIIEQPKNEVVNKGLTKLVKRKISYTKTGIKNAVKETIGMFKIESPVSHDKFSLETVLLDYIKTLSHTDEMRLFKVLSQMSNEINLGEFVYIKAKLEESIIWLNINRNNLDYSNHENLKLQLEISNFINKID